MRLRMIKSLCSTGCFLIAIGIALHHYIETGRLFDWVALAHHEPAIVALICLGIGIITGQWKLKS